mmetsp:Transcript_18118/g.68671  ORF Transcript_18118/g.68671 Transcript_18118/m.68671 type:complete len:274 (-) Transcript_18118:495-1316(-)
MLVRKIMECSSDVACPNATSPKCPNRHFINPSSKGSGALSGCPWGEAERSPLSCRGSLSLSLPLSFASRLACGTICASGETFSSTFCCSEEAPSASAKPAASASLASLGLLVLVPSTTKSLKMPCVAASCSSAPILCASDGASGSGTPDASWSEGRSAAELLASDALEDGLSGWISSPKAPCCAQKPRQSTSRIRPAIGPFVSQVRSRVFASMSAGMGPAFSYARIAPSRSAWNAGLVRTSISTLDSPEASQAFPAGGAGTASPPFPSGSDPL